MKRLPLAGVLTLTCREASRLSSDALDRPLQRREAAALGLHRGVCGSCRRFGRQLNVLDRLLRRVELSPPEPPVRVDGLSLAARERIRRRLTEAESAAE